MRILILLFAASLLSCSTRQGKKQAIVTDTIKVASVTGSGAPSNGEDVGYRQEYISTYNQDLKIDTVFTVGNEIYKVHFRHYCTWDSGLVVPARYNFESKKDFLTHHFESDLAVLQNGDTTFRKIITKRDFAPLLYPALEQYATLLYPSIEIQNDSINLFYSISIPVTDVGIGAAIQFDYKGNFRVR